MDFFVWQRTIVNELGTVLPSASVSVTDVVSGALAQLYSDEGVTGIGNPITADANGFVQFYVKSGSYDIAASLGVDSRTWNDENIGSPIRITAAELSAGVTPTRYQHEPGDFRRHGAIGDGATDDGAAVRAAVLQSLQAGGAMPFGQSGHTYLCTTWTAIDTTSDLRLRGNGCTLKGPASDTDFCRPGGAVDVEGVTFDRWLSVFEREVAETGSIDGFRVRRCEFNDIASVVINIERPITNYWICQNHFHDCAGAGVIRIGRNTQSEQTGWTNGHILHNVVETITIPGASDAGAFLVYGYDVEIKGNIIDGVSGGSAETWGIYTKCIGGTVHDNIVRNISCSGANAWGINIKGEVRTQTSSPQGFAASVQGNYVHTVTASAGGYCIRLQTDSVICQGNRCEDAGDTGIGLDYATAAITGISSAVIKGNLVRFTTAGSTVGIRVSTGLSYVDVSHNIVVNASIGARLASITGSETDWSVTHNTLEITAQGILVRRDEEITGLLIAFNIVKGAPSTGIRFETGTGVLSGVRVYDNDLAVATTQLSGTFPGDVNIRHSYTFQQTVAGPTTIVTFNLADEAAYFFNMKAIGVLSDGAEVDGYHRDATIRVNGGTAAVVGATQEVSTPQEDTAAWDVTIDAVSQTARLRATGEASHTINMKADFEILGRNAA